MQVSEVISGEDSTIFISFQGLPVKQHECGTS